ncbi:hypothetical protein O3G_MSEX004984 [Manduca sexta]|uniref:Ommochrome-binding protein-like n=1 Tax=Manduca sexta TaxID=7130 RepID=A0A921YX13_MANSE|nr:hypothetical protein O3G_MSEX004984 [Manduca sexta]
MKTTYLILMLTLVESKYLNKLCDLPTNDPTKQCYVKEALFSISHSPNQLAVDKSTNTLYFSFDTGQGEYIPALLKIDTRKLTVLQGIKDAFAIASSPGEMYFGGSYGIYKYDTIKRNLWRLNVPNLDIWWLFIKKNIHFIKFPSLNAYSYSDRTVKEMKAFRSNIVHQFVIDKNDNLFFINSTGLYGIKSGTNVALLLKNSPRFIGMAIDHKNVVHVCSEEGIYVVRKMIQKVKKIISIQGVLGMTFDKVNNLIYSDSHELVRLIPMAKGTYVSNGI